MPAVDIPAAKLAGLPVDLDRLTAEGDDWLSAEERYALKGYGVCTQTQPGVFMVRIRTGNGRLSSDAARGLASIADLHGRAWIHLTTRQQAELHHVPASEVTTVLAELDALGLSATSSCGHTVRGVMACPDAGVGLDEPFDCSVDAHAVTTTVLARAHELNCRLPQRLNIAFGGCESCRQHAKTNEAGFVSVVRDGVPGYELWLGGSLGKSTPTLARQALAFLPRHDVLPAVHALLAVFTGHGSFDKPAKARLKFLIRELGFDGFVDLFEQALSAARTRPWPAPAPVEALPAADAATALAASPEGGWGSGVRPQRTAGHALATVAVPLGDLDSDDLRMLADLADSAADRQLLLTRNQNVTLRDVPLALVPAVRAQLATTGLGLEGGDQGADLRACTGGPVCSLALTAAQQAATELADSAALARNSGLRVHLSGCMNACAQHQIADIGLSGGKVTVGGESMLGYQVWLGGDLATDRVARVAGRIAEVDVVAITEAVIGVWEALRGHGETLPATVQRIGFAAFQAHIAAVFTGRWEDGPEPGDPPLSLPAAEGLLPLVEAG